MGLFSNLFVVAQEFLFLLPLQVVFERTWRTNDACSISNNIQITFVAVLIRTKLFP